jgi:hypothetical protein
MSLAVRGIINFLPLTGSSYLGLTKLFIKYTALSQLLKQALKP